MQGRARVLLIALTLLAVGLTSDAASHSTLTLRIGPELSLAPATVQIVAIVQPDAQNRTLIVEVDSDEHYTRSDMMLNGEKAPKSHSLWLKNLPAGRYAVTAKVRRQDGQASGTNRAFEVRGEAEEPPER